ncbi:hypothetical protein [Streptomyces sp. CB02115]|uniref:hypothetical protein n=1 Tax=Streptomyces sp. CB02115 TaxID=1703939 RepID=UPI000A7483E9|nr:hypothetical protein [Streptomyces sp. CB02115]
MSWGEFCYGPGSGDHTRLYTRLTGGTKPEHSVAVYSHATAVERDRQDGPVLRFTPSSR